MDHRAGVHRHADMAALTKQSCAAQGACQGRTIPCLTCTRPGVEPWPAEHDDTFGLSDWAIGLLLMLLALAVGAVYGLLRRIFPNWIS